MTPSFSPGSVQSGGSSTLTFTVASSAPTGTFTVTVTGTGPSATHTATFSLTISTGTPPTTSPPPGGTTWAVGVDYAVGNRVTFEGVTYQCQIAHRSQADWTPPATPALWIRIG